MKLTDSQIRAIQPLVDQEAAIQQQAAALRQQVALIIGSWDPPEGWALNRQTWELEVAANVLGPETDGQ